MKYENKFGLPDEVVQWIMTDDYDYEEGVFSATRLMKPVRAVVLEQRHCDDIVIDVSDLIPAKYGTALHDSFEKLELKDCIQEKRYYADIGDYEISGKPDILLRRTDLIGKIKDKIKDKLGIPFKLKDIKSTSVWGYVYPDKDVEYQKQLSIYAYILRMNGLNIEDVAEIIFLFTDWSRSKARQGGDYPPTRIATKDIELWSMEETRNYIMERLELFHHHLENTEDDNLPECTRSELWQKDDKWAVMKEGRKSAVKLHDTEESAFEHIDNVNAGGHSIEHRPGKVNRCNYCNARAFCKQYAKMSEDGIIAD